MKLTIATFVHGGFQFLAKVCEAFEVAKSVVLCCLSSNSKRLFCS